MPTPRDQVRDDRIVAVWRQTGLGTAALAERFGLTRSRIKTVINRATAAEAAARIAARVPPREAHR